MRRIAVLTSGGDAPGMNAAIRAVVRAGQDAGFEVFGVERGFNGLLGGSIAQLGSRAVSGIIQQGGTFLGTARCPEFATQAGRKQALGRLSEYEIEALVVIGGNGSQQGAFALSEAGFPVVGIASTIDNDLAGSDITIGVDFPGRPARNNSFGNMCHANNVVFEIRTSSVQRMPDMNILI